MNLLQSNHESGLFSRPPGALLEGKLWHGFKKISLEFRLDFDEFLKMLYPVGR